MENYEVFFILIAIGVILWFVSWICEKFSNSNKYEVLKPKLDNLENSIKEHSIQIEKDDQAFILKEKQLNKKMEREKEVHGIKVGQARAEWRLMVAEWKKKVEQDKEDIQKIAKQKSMGFPWLADAYAEYFLLQDLKKEEYLIDKKHPAYTAAQTVREIKKEKRNLLRGNKIIKYKISYYEKLFPWLTELIAIDENDEIPVRIDEGDVSDVDNEDNVKNFLTPEEYVRLPSVERNQKALDRYLKNRYKSKWQIGRDYEMYVGYLYEKEGYSIEYKGIIDGFDDLGRDVIAIKNDEVCVIQCKYWARYKEIHENHIFQLFGTTMEYWIKNYRNNTRPKDFGEFAKFLNENKLRPIIFTSTLLSDTAKEMANALSVEIKENQPIGDFPRIKCNISNREGEKIYHLPFDQQYDRTIIEKYKGEFHAYTVQEAEDAGFRRAFRHRF
ncbi:MAG: restriction endonuclease [Elusimicrobia bacterium]|nr:restriction endonuclease [Elusimicrobiota bacterium]